jgi:hypothetical protein
MSPPKRGSVLRDGELSAEKFDEQSEEKVERKTINQGRSPIKIKN